MSGSEPDNIVLRYLRDIDMKLDVVIAETRTIRQRVSSCEQSIARMAATEAEHFAVTASMLDNVADRVTRIEKRLQISTPEPDPDPIPFPGRGVG